MTSTDTLPLAEGNTASYAGAIRVANALTETTAPKNPTAIVEAGFLKYQGGDNTDETQLKATVGSFMIGAAEAGHLMAGNGGSSHVSEPDTARERRQQRRFFRRLLVC